MNQYFSCFHQKQCIRIDVLIMNKKAAAFIEDCRFADCFCEQGGAFYGASSAPVTITGCEFERCRAKYLGDAIYFTYKRYGQEVSDCYFDEMERALFNVCDGKKFL